MFNLKTQGCYLYLSSDKEGKKGLQSKFEIKA